MSTVFITQNIWPQLTKAVRGSRQPCFVTVAYCGAGASRLLPLPENSRLVVDASERAVASGQTCPADQIKLVKRRVAVYIGSTNVSTRSASQLVEAVVRTTDPGAVRAARNFVRDHCLHGLTPIVLKRLLKIYRPPKVPGGKPGKKVTKETFRHPTLPRLLLAQLHVKDWSERDLAIHDAALVVAKKRREHPRS